MSFQGDPYRTLGVGPGASLNEIKSAYRRLVKQYHPDAAGERALPRFLAIQAAYERLVDGEGHLRPVMGPARRPAPAPEEPWRADPGRARASRDAWRARRAGGQTQASAGGGTRGPGRSRSTSGAGTTGGFGWAKPGAGARRGPRKATPGSTTYDEAAELPLDPEWDGGAWYGPSSGTYWTLNPREYADPRKHGPEYQARARRAAQAQRSGLAEDPADGGGDAAAGQTPGADTAPDGEHGPGPAPTTESAGEAPRWGWTGGGGTTTDGGTEWGTGQWHYDDAAAQPAPGERRRDGPQPAGAEAADASRDGARDWGADDAAPDLESLARRLSPRSLLRLARRPDRRWRLLLALAGWPPIGWAVGTLTAQATACAPAAPGCIESLQVLPVLFQPLVIAGLFLVPPAAAVAAFAGLVTVAVALPAAAILSLVGAADGSSTSPVLGVLAAVAYGAALVTGASLLWRAPDGVGMGRPET